MDISTQNKEANLSLNTKPKELDYFPPSLDNASKIYLQKQEIFAF